LLGAIQRQGLPHITATRISISLGQSRHQAHCLVKVDSKHTVQGQEKSRRSQKPLSPAGFLPKPVLNGTQIQTSQYDTDPIQAVEQTPELLLGIPAVHQNDVSNFQFTHGASLTWQKGKRRKTK